MSIMRVDVGQNERAFVLVPLAYCAADACSRWA